MWGLTRKSGKHLSSVPNLCCILYSFCCTGWPIYYIARDILITAHLKILRSHGPTTMCFEHLQAMTSSSHDFSSKICRQILQDCVADIMALKLIWSCRPLFMSFLLVELRSCEKLESFAESWERILKNTLDASK